MADIELTAAERRAVVARLREWFVRELDQDLGGFDAEFLLDFFLAEIGPVFYNRGLLDAQAVVDERMESVKDAIAELERPMLDAAARRTGPSPD